MPLIVEEIHAFKAKKYQKKMIILDSVVRANKKYYPQTLLEECKCEIEKNKMENLINDDLNPSSSDKFDNESDNEFDNETDN